MFQTRRTDLVSEPQPPRGNIADKYVDALGQMRCLHPAAVQVCLLLALQEQRELDAQVAVAQPMLRASIEAQDGEIQAKRQAIERLRARLAAAVEEITRLTTVVAEMDAANADLLQQLIRTDSDNADLALRLAARATLPATPVEDAQPQPVAVEPVTDGIDWSTLSVQADDFRISVDAGRRNWRQVPKEIRLELIQCVLAQHTPDGEPMTMAYFDGLKPMWMATASSNPTVFGCTWRELPVISLS